jgi:RimJ/RimL family protein N-acetyltransferase
VQPLELRKTLPDDLPFILEQERQPENARYVIGWPADKHRRALDDPDMLHGILFSNQKMIGYVILAGLKNPNRSVEFMRIVISEKGAGHGRAAVRLICKKAFEELGAHRLWLDVKTFNERAKSLYVSEGFQTEGILRDCIKSEDGYQSLAVLSILEPEFRAMAPRRSW